jgi:hypothetical protein
LNAVKKKKNNNGGTVTGWGTALNAAGIATPTTSSKKSKLTVVSTIKKNQSDSNFQSSSLKNDDHDSFKAVSSYTNIADLDLEKLTPLTRSDANEQKYIQPAADNRPSYVNTGRSFVLADDAFPPPPGLSSNSSKDNTNQKNVKSGLPSKVGGWVKGPTLGGAGNAPSSIKR